MIPFPEHNLPTHITGAISPAGSADQISFHICLAPRIIYVSEDGLVNDHPHRRLACVLFMSILRHTTSPTDYHLFHLPLAMSPSISDAYTYPALSGTVTSLIITSQDSSWPPTYTHPSAWLRDVEHCTSSVFILLALFYWVPLGFFV